MAKSQDFYEAALEIMKTYNLTPDEKNAIREAKSKITNHMYFVSAAGGVVGFLLGKHRRFRPLATIAVGVGGAIIGGQIGLVTGSLSAMNTIRKLPSSEKILALMKDMQMEMIKKRTALPQGPSPAPGMPPHPFNKSYEQSKNRNDDFSETVTFSDDGEDHVDLYSYKGSSSDEVMRDDGVDNTNNQPDWSSKSERAYSPSSQNAPPSCQQRQVPQQRQEMPSSSSSPSVWRQQSDSSDEVKEAVVDYDNTFYPPRTREDTERVQRDGKLHTNKYGDIT
ncbi:7711_t:CDS:2 [Ambispora gerdemannii]|uniref:7711_t:CDS:1 n=1 Tax=Ambispora gerdemannii TaxID=144530 RepID=A0A9N8V1T9_9GLOM|nr:7711_t:CDS:2 [Ambispora gerdemannii]